MMMIMTMMMRVEICRLCLLVHGPYMLPRPTQRSAAYTLWSSAGTTERTENCSTFDCRPLGSTVLVMVRSGVQLES